MSHLITNLDIGSSHIKGAVVAQKDDGKLSVVHTWSTPSTGVRKGVMVDVEEMTAVLRDLALHVQHISKKALHNVFINMNSEHIKARASRGIVAVARADQEIQQDDIDRVIQASRAVKTTQNYTVIHNIIREYFVDDIGDIPDPLGMTGNRLEVSTLIIEAFAPHVNALLKNIERVGMRIGGIIFNPLAASRAVLTKRQKDLGVVLIDFGADTTSFVLYEENKVVYAKSFPVGSGHITKDIAIGLKTSMDIAEKLKVTYGCSLVKEAFRKESIDLSQFDTRVQGEISKRFFTEIIEVRLAEILDLVNNDLKGLGRLSDLPAGVVITGGGSKLTGLSEMVRQKMRLPVQIGLPNLELFSLIDPSHEEMLNNPEFAVALGLALWGGVEEQIPSTSVQTMKHFFKNLIP